MTGIHIALKCISVRDEVGENHICLERCCIPTNFYKETQFVVMSFPLMSLRRRK